MKPYCCVEVPALCTPCPSLLPVECTARFWTLLLCAGSFLNCSFQVLPLFTLPVAPIGVCGSVSAHCAGSFNHRLGGPALCTRGYRARLRKLRPVYTLSVAPATNPNNCLKRSFFTFRCSIGFVLRTKPNPKRQAKPILRVLRTKPNPKTSQTNFESPTVLKAIDALNGSFSHFGVFLYYERSQTQKNEPNQF